MVQGTSNLMPNISTEYQKPLENNGISELIILLLTVTHSTCCFAWEILI